MTLNIPKAEKPSSRKGKSDWKNSKLNISIPQPIRAIFGSFSPYWLACIPLSAAIVIVWHTAASAQRIWRARERR